ncbi:MAG: response regulator transcription factor [Candidatus Pacebacteria bacterium]|jgi:two-component system response regulator VicR|nr:response regulator transcription factor [Candidatus Paceibacterota bacterium]
MFKILVLEDDLILLKTLKQVLIKSKYHVDLAHELERAGELIDNNDYDLLIFDRFINREDGLDFLVGLRAEQSFVRVLLISQKKLLVDRLMALKLADDFLAKPFVVKELLLKVTNLLSRSKCRQEERYICPYFYLNDAGLLQDLENADCFYLPKKERQILECLLIHQNQAVSYQTLIDYVWPRTDNIPQQRTLNVYVRRIRLKIGRFSGLVKTIRDYGFILDCNKEESAR